MPADNDLATELEAMTRLHEIATRFIREGDLEGLLTEALDAAIAFSRADKGHLQLVDQATGEARLAAQRGFGPGVAPAFKPAAAGAAGQNAGWWQAGISALARRERAVIEDIESTPLLPERPIRDALLATGVRALQSTLLRTAAGEIVGVLSTHWRRKWRSSARDLRLLDLVARQCADAVERARWAAERAQVSARAEELFRTTVENIPVNLVIYDSDYRILYMNPPLAAVCAAICKLTPAELVGRRGAELWPEPVWKPLHAHTERALATGERQTYDLVADLPGRPRSVRQWTVVPLTQGRGSAPRILAMSHDITAQRRLVDELREADRRKSEFIAVLSHELRNPLAAIQTSLHVLEHGAPGGHPLAHARQVPPAHERQVPQAHARQIIDRQVGHLVQMVDDLLDVTRITQNKVKLQRRRLDVNELVRETVEDNRPHLERGGVRVDAGLARAPIYVNADRARIAQVVTNLLSNAVKFTPAGGRARVSVATGAGDRAVLRVTDTGTGIEPALLPRLFQPFMQADRTLDRSGGGLGLGLALVKGLVELHGGEVSARSEGQGKGAEFTVHLPLDAVAAGGRNVRVPRRRSAREQPPRVLVIEDDADVAEGLRAALEVERHDVRVAHDGHEGIARARELVPDIVLCDIGLPGMDGYEVARSFRADRALRSTFLVALSGYAQPEDLVKARAAGFDHHLAKPASIDKIMQTFAARSTPRRRSAAPGGARRRSRGARVS